VAEIHLLTGTYTGIDKPTKELSHFDHSSPDQFQQVQQAIL
jgi:hypothetical protein